MSAVSDAIMNPAYAGLTPQGAPDTGMPTGGAGGKPDNGMPSGTNPAKPDTGMGKDTGMPMGNVKPKPYTNM
jgi:hypothetical protein